MPKKWDEFPGMGACPLASAGVSTMLIAMSYVPEYAMSASKATGYYSPIATPMTDEEQHLTTNVETPLATR